MVLELIRDRARGAGAAAREMVLTQEGRTHLVFDSPHSGTQYPPDFHYACDLAVLRQAEDTHVEKLFGFAPSLGIAWIEALFPRSYIDVNRGEDAIDLGLIDGPWPGPIATDPAIAAKLRMGKGLVWRCTDNGVPIYEGRLRPFDVASRIDRCWRPYHRAVAQAIDAAHARHGWSVHLNCHSMPAVAASHATEFPGLAHADIVLGDRDGTTASPRLIHLVADVLRGFGYSVAANHPYKGVELVRRYSDPRAGRHSLQLEVNRRLYMDEATLELHGAGDRLERHLRELAGVLLQLAPGDLA